MSERKHQCNFRLTDDERERFARIAAHYGIPIAAMIRMLVKREDDALRLERPKGRPGEGWPDGSVQLPTTPPARIDLSRRRGRG